MIKFWEGITHTQTLQMFQLSLDTNLQMLPRPQSPQAVTYQRENSPERLDESYTNYISKPCPGSNVNCTGKYMLSSVTCPQNPWVAAEGKIVFLA